MHDAGNAPALLSGLCCDVLNVEAQSPHRQRNRNLNMNTTTHTPSPWTTDEADHDEPHQDIKIKAGKHHTVCTVWIDDAPVRDFNAEQRANARLIAAAPDLLAQLSNIVEMIDPEGHDVNFDEARAAIAAATQE